MVKSNTVVCQLDELADPGCLGLGLVIDDRQYDTFVVRRDNQVFAYLNSCPHTGGPLDWVPHQFLDLDKAYIQCATHDALFQIDDGYCIAGPCKGDRLMAIPVVVVAGEVIIEHRGFPVVDS
jgi:nitrite reductase/ring-hydroxylating ferredoxin subunit